jgi:hypothetical protein
MEKVALTGLYTATTAHLQHFGSAGLVHDRKSSTHDAAGLIAASDTCSIDAAAAATHEGISTHAARYIGMLPHMYQASVDVNHSQTLYTPERKL